MFDFPGIYFSLSLIASMMFDPFLFFWTVFFLSSFFFAAPLLCLCPPLPRFHLFPFLPPSLLPDLPYFNLDLSQALLCWLILSSFPLQSVPSPASGSASPASPPHPSWEMNMSPYWMRRPEQGNGARPTSHIFFMHIENMVMSAFALLHGNDATPSAVPNGQGWCGPKRAP